MVSAVENQSASVVAICFRKHGFQGIQPGMFATQQARSRRGEREMFECLFTGERTGELLVEW